MSDLRDLISEALVGALADGEISVADFEDWKGFKKKLRKQLRKFLKRVESETIEVDPADALLILAILARL